MFSSSFDITGSRRVGHDWATSLSLFSLMHWRRKWQPTPVFLPGESQGWEPGGLPSMESHRVGHDWCDLAAAAANLTSYINWKLFSPLQFSWSVCIECLLLIGSRFTSEAIQFWNFLVSRSRGWDGWMPLPIQWAWTSGNSRRWWGTGKPGVLQSMGSQSWTQLDNWTTASFLNTNSICLTGMRLFKLSIYYWVSFGNLCLLWVELFHLKIYMLKS